MQTYSQSRLLDEIESFLAETGMGEQYFGKCAAGISDIVPRLRNGGSIRLSTAERVQIYMATKRRKARKVEGT